MSELTAEEFRQTCREAAVVYRSQANDFDALAERDYPGEEEAFRQIAEIQQRTAAAIDTLATELEADGN